MTSNTRSSLPRFPSLLAGGLLSLMLLGCGGSGAGESEPIAPGTSSQVRPILESAAATGDQLGSGSETLRTAIEDMRATDAAKTDELLKDLAELERANQPAKVKAIAQRMLGKL